LKLMSLESEKLGPYQVPNIFLKNNVCIYKKQEIKLTAFMIIASSSFIAANRVLEAGGLVNHALRSNCIGIFCFILAINPF